MMVDDVLIDANGPLLTPLSPIPENDKVKHKLFLEQEQRYSWNSQSRHWSEFVRAWRERCPEPKSSEAFRQWMDDTKKCYQILCAGWERRESEASGFAVDICLPAELSVSSSRPANIVTTSTEISLLRISTDSLPGGSASDASPMPRASAAKSSGLYSSLSAEFLADLESLADSIHSGFRPSDWPTSSPSTEVPVASPDGENYSSNSNSSSDIGNTAVLFSPPKSSSSPTTADYLSYRSSLAVEEAPRQAGDNLRRLTTSELSISPSSTESPSRGNDTEAANISELVAAMENPAEHERHSITPRKGEGVTDVDVLGDESPILPQRTPVLDGDLDDCESLVILGASFGSGSGPLSSSSGRRNGTLDFILHRTPLESISEELEEAEPDPIGVTRQDSNSFPLNRGATITPDRDDSRSGQDYDVLVVRVNSAFSSAANSPLLPTEETRSDMINADGDSIPSVPGQRRSERELFPAQDDESSLHCDSRAPTATSSPLQDSSSGSQYEHAGGSSMEDSNAYKDCDEASRLGEDCHSNDHHLEASIMEEIDLSSGYYTDNTMDERESSVSDKTATRESDGSPGDDSNDPSEVDVVSAKEEEVAKEPLGLRCWFTRERSPSPSLSQPDEPRMLSSRGPIHRRSRSADLTNARCLHTTFNGGNLKHSQYSMSSRRCTSILTTEERELLKIREEKESMRNQMLRNRRFAARIYSENRPTPSVRERRPIRPLTKHVIKEQPLRKFRF